MGGGAVRFDYTKDNQYNMLVLTVIGYATGDIVMEISSGWVLP